MTPIFLILVIFTSIALILGQSTPQQGPPPPMIDTPPLPPSTLATTPKPDGQVSGKEKDGKKHRLGGSSGKAIKNSTGTSAIPTTQSAGTNPTTPFVLDFGTPAPSSAAVGVSPNVQAPMPIADVPMAVSASSAAQASPANVQPSPQTGPIIASMAPQASQPSLVAPQASPPAAPTVTQASPPPTPMVPQASPPPSIAPQASPPMAPQASPPPAPMAPEASPSPAPVPPQAKPASASQASSPVVLQSNAAAPPKAGPTVAPKVKVAVQQPVSSSTLAPQVSKPDPAVIVTKQPVETKKSPTAVATTIAATLSLATLVMPSSTQAAAMPQVATSAVTLATSAPPATTQAMPQATISAALAASTVVASSVGGQMASTKAMPVSGDTTITSGASSQISDQDYAAAESSSSLGDSFAGQTLQKCAGKPHPVLVISKILKDKGIDKEFKDNMCRADYHISCNTPIWSGCQVTGAKKFCPKTCKISDCSALKAHGNDDKSKPVIKSKADCKDSSAVNCSSLYDRGDCFAMPGPLSSLCPKTCGFCEQDNGVAPFMPDQEKLYWWLSTYQDGKYSDYAQMLAEKESQLKENVNNGSC
uniref:ShKT domain-containing protein n=1 Tax=Romanomermis culicivorax TaxID=13658 RepID=A0A915JE64_ROMCU